MADKLLIVGGTGFIGRNLTVSAVKSGFNTTVLSRNIADDQKIIKGVDYLQADIVDYGKLREELSNTAFDYVVNLAGYIDHSRFLEGGKKVINVHFNGVQNLLQLLDWKKLKRFIQIGSSDEYGNLAAPQNEKMRESPISSYSLGKVASTQLLQMLHRTEGFPAVIIRLFLVYGPGQDKKRFLPQIIQGCLSGENFPTSGGEQLRDLCYIDDVTSGILMALVNDRVNGEVINLASGKPVVIREAVELVERIVSRGTSIAGIIPYRIGENMELYGDISKAKDMLMWEPKIQLEEGIRRTIQYYRDTAEV